MEPCKVSTYSPLVHDISLYLLQLYKESIDKFGALDAECPIPPKCIISVYGCPSPTTVPMLYYAVPLKGVLHPVTLFINISSRNIPPTPHPSSGN